MVHCTLRARVPCTRPVLTFELDVAFLSADLTVIQLVRVAPWRVALPRKGTRSVLQAEAGALGRWGVRVADRLEIREVR